MGYIAVEIAVPNIKFARRGDKYLLVCIKDFRILVIKDDNTYL
jgi:hypothetical protein